MGYQHFPKKVCTSEDNMLWLANGDSSTTDTCKAMAQLTGTCAHPKTIAFEDGGDHNCYCATSSVCAKTSSDWLSLYVPTGAQNATSLALTSTGRLYKSQVRTTSPVSV